MQTIKRKNLFFAVLTGLSILTVIVLMVLKGNISEMLFELLLALSIIVGLISAAFLQHEYSKLNSALLIAENPILQLNTAVISDLSNAASPPETVENTEVIVSYFGIILGSEIINFNQGGARLKDVEIGNDFISFTYGKEEKLRSVRLLRPEIEPVALEQISEQFRYETGITPKMSLK